MILFVTTVSALQACHVPYPEGERELQGIPIVSPGNDDKEQVFRAEATGACNLVRTGMLLI